MGQRIAIVQREWELAIHDHNRDLSVTKVRCKDLLDSDQGDFRCQCAIGISS